MNILRIGLSVSRCMPIQRGDHRCQHAEAKLARQKLHVVASRVRCLCLRILDPPAHTHTTSRIHTIALFLIVV
jgi:hypothetical protein